MKENKTEFYNPETVRKYPELSIYDTGFAIDCRLITLNQLSKPFETFVDSKKFKKAILGAYYGQLKPISITLKGERMDMADGFYRSLLTHVLAGEEGRIPIAYMTGDYPLPAKTKEIGKFFEGVVKREGLIELTEEYVKQLDNAERYQNFNAAFRDGFKGIMSFFRTLSLNNKMIPGNLPRGRTERRMYKLEERLHQLPQEAH